MVPQNRNSCMYVRVVKYKMEFLKIYEIKKTDSQSQKCDELYLKKITLK